MAWGFAFASVPIPEAAQRLKKESTFFQFQKGRIRVEVVIIDSQASEQIATNTDYAFGRTSINSVSGGGLAQRHD